MFDTRRFGAYIARLRKGADMTQSELSDKLNITRQAVSKYEVGDSFPDVSILIIIADTFGVSVDDLINSGDPTRGEAMILSGVASGKHDFIAQNVIDIMSLAPYLKPSVLDKLSVGLSVQGIDISNIVSLANYLSDSAVIELLENAKLDSVEVTNELIGKLIPLLDDRSKLQIFDKILSGEMDWHMIRVLLPYAYYLSSQIEAAVVEGALPWEALKVLQEAWVDIYEKRKKDDIF